MASRKKNKDEALFSHEPLWYKDAVIYELHVRAYSDSSGDGIGDFHGLESKLDYLQDLGVTAIWILPFYPSPLRDDGYDIADYNNVHSSYGTLRDFKDFLRGAHERGMRVITELVLNHTSDQHYWFRRARQARPGSPERDFYVWSDTNQKYRDTRIIFQDFEHSNWTWDPVANAYYWHRFYSHQPDLNYDNPAVKETMYKVLSFWLQLGVDGLRLDAVPYLYEREGTNCENLPETHQALRELRAFVDRHFQDRMLLAEANQWPEDSVAYFGAGDECHMAFHFPLMPRMFMAMRMEDRYPVIDILAQTPKVPENCQWALFLRNHDELTLEMVTDEERDYMYRTYATDPEMRINLGIRRRLAPLLGNDRRKIELMNGLLFSLPGTPVIYYGDEIGMGDNVYLGDRNGVRTPMQWTPDRNAGFSRANSQRLYLPINIDPDFHYEALNVDAQQNNPNSLLWWMKRLISLRKRYKAFGRGTLEFLFPENRKVLAYIRRYEDEIILVVANLSRLAQYVELDLSMYNGMVPMELSGQTDFPRIGELTYLLTLGPHAFYWFVLRQKPTDVEAVSDAVLAEPSTLAIAGGWDDLFDALNKEALEEVLPNYLRGRRWFAGKARAIQSVEIVETAPVTHDTETSYLALARVEYTEGDPELYVIGMGLAVGARAEQLLRELPQGIVAKLQSKSGSSIGVIYEANRERTFSLMLLDAISRRKRFKAESGEFHATSTGAFRKLRGPGTTVLEPTLVRAEQSNSSLVFGDRFILKFFRKLDVGENPDLEVTRFLYEKTDFEHIPRLAGWIEYRRNEHSAPMTVGMLQEFIKNEGDAWQYTLDNLARYFEQVRARRRRPREAPAVLPLVEMTQGEIPRNLQSTIGAYLESARLLGERTAEMHLALGSQPDEPAFAPEPFSTLYQRSIYQSMRNLTSQVFQLLRNRRRRLLEAALPQIDAVLEQESTIMGKFHVLLEQKFDAQRIRIHGDYHLGQVLYTGRDFAIIDFEGEPARAISERRIKRSPLRDVAGMVRSFHYASYTRLFEHLKQARPEEEPELVEWARQWYSWVSSAFLKRYLAICGTRFVPGDSKQLQKLLNVYLLEKAIYELGYELNNRPDWIRLPLSGIQQIISDER